MSDSQSLNYEDITSMLDRLKNRPREGWESPQYFAFLAETGQADSVDAYISFLRLAYQGNKEVVETPEVR